MKESVHITLDAKVLAAVREKKDKEGFCLSRYLDSHLRDKFKLDLLRRG